MDYQHAQTRFVVGLGNPGRRYARTRHNVGWLVLAVLRKRWAIAQGKMAFGGELFDGGPVGQAGAQRRVMLFEPHMYMNRSGSAVKGLMVFYEAQPRDVLVVLDDMALPLGALRARASGSGGGHNGLKDILKVLTTHDIPRVRVGIGPAAAGTDGVDYVLGTFAPQELEIIEETVERAADAVEDWIAYDINRVMDKYNRKTNASPPESEGAGEPESHEGESTK